MKPDSITEVDTKEKETMPDEHGTSATVDTDFSSARPWTAVM
jgi:hypothetical protein